MKVNYSLAEQGEGVVNVTLAHKLASLSETKNLNIFVVGMIFKKSRKFAKLMATITIKRKRGW